MQGIELFLLYVLAIILVEFILKRFIIKGDREKIYTTTFLLVMGFFALIIVVLFTVVLYSGTAMSYLLSYIAILACLAFGFRAFMEGKFIRETNSHFVSLISLAISFVFAIILRS
ncbi:DUF4181 domain-containing protein [Paenibacillus faecalis]|uniref:DUF4181 domain-containing protein n=1 Tax=Paenibacillus faecalis TaxID=2079532 RepID=UPI000D10C91D|nr:DUF4181 domain-containing protein [Paenibacillus faecalis]